MPERVLADAVGSHHAQAGHDHSAHASPPVFGNRRPSARRRLLVVDTSFADSARPVSWAATIHKNQLIYPILTKRLNFTEMPIENQWKNRSVYVYRPRAA